MSSPLYSIVFSAPLASTVANGVAGDVLIPDSTSTSGLYVLATTANVGTRRSTGVALNAYSANGIVELQQSGQLDATTAGLGAGLASFVRVSTLGKLERVTTPTALDDVVGWCEVDGTTHLLFGQAPGGWGSPTIPLPVASGGTGATSLGASGGVLFNNAGVVAGSGVVSISEAAQEFDIVVANQSTLARLTNYSAASANGANIILNKARGTVGAPTRALANDQLGGVLARGWHDDGTPSFVPSTAPGFRFLAGEDFTATNQGTYFTLSLSKLGTTGPAAEVWRVDGNGKHTLTAKTASTGSTGLIAATAAAHTAQTASTELSDVLYDCSASLQFATGNFATQRQSLIKARTYTAVGASVITNAATLAIDKAPVAGSAMTLTNTYALWVQAGMTRLDGALTVSGGNFLFFNPAGTFKYTITPAAIAADRTLTLPLLAGNDTMVCEAFAQTLTNKTIDAASNTISNISNASLSASAAIAASKIAPPGSNTYVLFNDAGVLNADAGFTYNKGSGTTVLFNITVQGTLNNSLGIVCGAKTKSGAFATTGVNTNANTGAQADVSTGGSNRVRLTNNVGPNISGFAAVALGAVDGEVLEVKWVGITTAATLVHDSALSIAANRILCPGAVDFTLTKNIVYSLQYDTTDSRWHMMNV